MSSRRRVRPTAPVHILKPAGRLDYNEPERCSSEAADGQSSEKCTLTDAQLEIAALADFAVTAFVEKRKQGITPVTKQSLSQVAASLPAVA